jgi:hypothetical protein
MQRKNALSILSSLRITMVSLVPASLPDLMSLILEEGYITLCFIPSMPLSCIKKFHRLFSPIFRLQREGSTCRLRSTTFLGPRKATSSGSGIGEVSYRNRFKITLVARLRNSSNARKKCQRGCLSSRGNCNIPF